MYVYIRMYMYIYTHTHTHTHTHTKSFLEKFTEESLFICMQCRERIRINF